MDLLLLLGVIVGSALLAWGLGWDKPAASVTGFAILLASTLGGLGVRLRPALVAGIVATGLVVVSAVLVIRGTPTGEAPSLAAPAPAATPRPTVVGPSVPTTPRPGEEPAAFGQRLAATYACIACHTTDGRPSTGPTWKGLYGKSELLQRGERVTVDDAYLRESILTPNAKIVQGFTPTMPQFRLTDAEVEALIAYIKTLR